MNISELLDLHLRGQLPEDVTLIYVPIRKTAYGDYQIVGEYRQPIHGDFGCVGNSESVELKWVSKQMFAGYGEKTKTLIVGREVVR